VRVSLSRLSIGARCVVFVLLAIGSSVVLLSDPVQTNLMPRYQVVLAELAGAILSGVGIEVRVDGILLHTAHGAVRVTNACSGFDAWLCLVSAIVVSPAAWRDRMRGIAVTFVALAGLNLLRVVTLAATVGGHSRLFDFGHYHFWPAAIVVACVLLLGASMFPGRAGDVQASR